MLARASALAGGVHRPPSGRRDGAALCYGAPHQNGGRSRRCDGRRHEIFYPRGDSQRGVPSLAALGCRARKVACPPVRWMVAEVPPRSFRSARGKSERSLGFEPELARVHWPTVCAGSRLRGRESSRLLAVSELSFRLASAPVFLDLFFRFRFPFRGRVVPGADPVVDAVESCGSSTLDVSSA